MKKKLTILTALLLTLILILAACGQKPADPVTPGNDTNSGNSSNAGDNTDSNTNDSGNGSGNNTDPDPEQKDEPSDGTGRWKGSDYISVRRNFTCKNGEFELILTGLTEDNIDYVFEALKDLDLESGVPFKLENEAFVDAEKWDNDVFDYEATYDANQCWAASAANMLWISGWTNGLSDPRTGSAFTSEDKIFEYYNEKFTDRGNDIVRALEWFFMGEYAPDWESSHPAVLQDDPDPKDGLIKDFVVTLAVKGYDLTADYTQIEQLERLDLRSEFPAVFQGSTGSSGGNSLSDSSHSIAVAGVIIDPNEKNADTRYKAVIIIDSDNDAHPDEEKAAREDITLEEKEADKEARPNSYTVYSLSRKDAQDGRKYWEIINTEKEEPTALYSIAALPMPSEAIRVACHEREGSCSVIDDPDFVAGLLFTTTNTDSLPDPFYFDPEDNIQNVFDAAEAINLNFFISNRGYRNFDDEYRGSASLTAEWKVTAADGKIMASGSTICNKELYNGEDIGYLVELNNTDGKVETWPSGKYTVTVTINGDRAIKEAYYLNNSPASYGFEIR